jgi:hypothetical protein
MPALVDFPIHEAEALLKRLGPDGPSMTAAECDAIDSARARINQAVKIERGPGGSEGESIEETAQRLLGQNVRVKATYGSVIVGKLEKVVGYRSLLISDGTQPHAINASLVASIEAVGL